MKTSACLYLLMVAMVAPSHVSAQRAVGAPHLPSAAVTHPVLLSQADDRRLKKNRSEQQALAEQVMELNREKLLGFICTDNGIDWPSPCPACGGKLIFTFAHPDALFCKACKTVVRENEAAWTGAIGGTSKDGREIVFHYEGKGRNRRFTGALLRNYRHAKLAEAARALGRLYTETGNEALARRAILILARFADVFPEWPVIRIESFPRPAKFCINPPRPYNTWTHYKWRHTNNYDIPYDLTFAYDFVYDAKAWENLPGGRSHVESNLLRAGHTQAWTTHEDMGLAVNNLTGTMLASTILLGRTLGDADMVHRATFTLKNMMRVFFHFDGMEYEGALTYHGTVTGRCGIAERMLRGYQDPPGYRDEKYGLKLHNPSLGSELPEFARSWKVWQLMRFPNGNPICIHDTNFPASRRPLAPNTMATNIELNAYGHFAIGRGQGLNGIQAHLHFCPFTQMSHYHRDKLSLILFGAGEELLSDTGYVHVRGKNRYFANSSLSHNTVTVEYDSPDKPLVLVKPGPEFIGTVERPKWAAMRNRPLQEARSTLIAYDPGVRGEKNVQLIAASVPGNSRSRLTHRTRELLLIALDENRSCLLDIFRVQGGVRQNFVLRPSCDEDVLAENCSLELGPERAGTLAGENLRYDEIPADRDNIIPYSWLVHRIRTADAESDWTLTWRGADSGSRLQAFIAGVENAEAWLGQSPSLRRARNNGKRADDFQNPHLLIRRPEDGGGITFAAVYECVPGNEQGAIRSVAFRWPEGNSSTAPLEVTIQMADGEIHVTANCLPIDGAARMVPSYSVAAELGGHAVWRWQWGKSRKRTRLALRTVYRTAAGDACNGFLVDGTIGGNAVLPGEWVRLVYGDERAYGYQVEKIVHQGKSTLVQIAGDPGIKKTGTGIELMYFPFYNTTGSPWIELPPATFAKHPVE